MNWNDLSKYRSQIYGLSMIWIVIFHFYESLSAKFDSGWLSTVIFSNGNIGVEVFLFLSAVSMSYSMKKYATLDRASLLHFYKRRFSKILKIYFTFCIPFLLLRDLILGKDPSKFLHQLTFTDSGVSSFWFLAAILICYLIYPLLEWCQRNNKRIHIGFGIGIYIIVLCVLNLIYPDIYLLYEILLTRIPIFLFGTFYANKVQEKQKITTIELIIFLMIVLFREPLAYACSRIPVLSALQTTTYRMSMGLATVGTIIALVQLIRLFENSRVDQFLKEVGKITLEIYVFHIAFRGLSIPALMHLGISFTAFREILTYGFVYIPISLLGGYLLHKVENMISFNKNS